MKTGFPALSIEQFPVENTARIGEIIRIGPFPYRVWMVFPGNRYLVHRRESWT